MVILGFLRTTGRWRSLAEGITRFVPILLFPYSPIPYAPNPHPPIAKRLTNPL
jgi:hypothetical protein